MPDAYLPRNNEIWVGDATRCVDLSPDSGGHNISNSTTVAVRQPLGTTITKREKLITERVVSLDALYWTADSDPLRSVFTSGAKSLVTIINRNPTTPLVDVAQQVWDTFEINAPTNELMTLTANGNPTDNWMQGALVYYFDENEARQDVIDRTPKEITLKADKQAYLLLCLQVEGHTSSAKMRITTTDPTDSDAVTTHNVTLKANQLVIVSTGIVDDPADVTNSSTTEVDISSTATSGWDTINGFIAVVQPLSNLP